MIMRDKLKAPAFIYMRVGSRSSVEDWEAYLGRPCVLVELTASPLTACSADRGHKLDQLTYRYQNVLSLIQTLRNLIIDVIYRI